MNRNERNITRAAANKRLAVPIVANATDPDNPNMTICWAASVASISMYKRPSLNMTAVNVISVLKTRYSLPGVGYFDSNWADEAFSLLNVSMNYSASGTNYNAVKGYITQNKPIYAGINDGDAYHAVVICGYIELATGEKYYSLMDPNKNSYVTTSSINANTTDFTYVTSGHVYTDWHRRFW